MLKMREKEDSFNLVFEEGMILLYFLFLLFLGLFGNNLLIDIGWCCVHLIYLYNYVMFLSVFMILFMPTLRHAICFICIERPKILFSYLNLI